ncbi:MAG: cadherin-like domain-containing protein, partial [Pseudomonadota bacterium]
DPAPLSPFAAQTQAQREAQDAAVAAEAEEAAADSARSFSDRTAEARAEAQGDAQPNAAGDAAEASGSGSAFAAPATALRNLAEDLAASEPEAFVEATSNADAEVADALAAAVAAAQAAAQAAADAAAEETLRQQEEAAEQARQEAEQEAEQEAQQEREEPSDSDPDPVVDPTLDLALGEDLGALGVVGEAGVAGGSSYAIVDDPSGLFAIDPATGQITLAAGESLDHETQPNHAFTVTYVDASGVAGSRAVAVVVEDRNDEAQSFLSANAFSVAEDAADGAVIYDADAIDGDGTGEAITYSLADDQGGLFAIDANTGEVSLATGRSLDFESVASYALEVISTDGVNSTSYAISATVTDVNDAPVLNTTIIPSLDPVVSDGVAPAPQRIGDIATGEMVSDQDGPVAGVAITGADTSNGVWEYSQDGVTFASIGSVSDGAALLLDKDDVIRFRPDADYSGAATLEFRAWDGSAGAAGDNVDASVTGGSAAFSVASATATVTVSAPPPPPNAAPELTASFFELPGATEDTVKTSTVADMLYTGLITDADGAVEAIALTGVGEGAGDWAFSIDGGNTFATIDPSSLSDTGAILLGPTAQIRFTPAQDFSGSTTLTFRAWDQTTGAEGDRADVSTNGGNTAFSSISADGAIAVAGVNDAPVLDDAAAHGLTGVVNDGATPAGQKVKDFIADGAITDADGFLFEGVAITAADSANGTWAFSLDGSTYSNFPSPLSNTNALLLGPNDYVRFTPDPSFAGASQISFRAWDGTDGAPGGVANVTTAGGDTAFSVEQAVASIDVVSGNSAPGLDGAASTTITVNDGETLITSVADFVVDGTITDADGAVEAIAVTGLGGGGTWAYSVSGAPFVDFAGVSETSAVLLDPTAQLRFTPDAGTGSNVASLSFRAWDQSSFASGDTGVDASVTGGVSPFSEFIATASVDVNAAPTIELVGSVNFAGNLGHVNAGDAGGDALDLGQNDRTIEAWFYWDGVAQGDQAIVSKGNKGSMYEGYSIRLDGDDLVVRMATDNGSTRAGQSIELDAPGWYHVAAVIDYGAGTINGFLNGSSDGWVQGHAPSNVVDNTFNASEATSNADSFIIGGQDVGLAVEDHFDGKVADVRVWDSARNGGEIAATMNQALDGSEPGLIAHWPLDDGSGFLADDQAGGYDAALLFFPQWVDPSNLTVEAGGSVSSRIVVDDAEGDTLTVAEKPGAGPANGSVTFDAATGAFTYTPDSGFTGSDSFSYQVTDEHGATASVDIAVTTV